MAKSFDWSYAPEREGLLLCSACGPTHYSNNEGPTQYGVWHGQFARIFLPKGEFHTNRVGNLEHTATGNDHCADFAIEGDTK